MYKRLACNWSGPPQRDPIGGHRTTETHTTTTQKQHVIEVDTHKKTPLEAMELLKHTTTTQKQHVIEVDATKRPHWRPWNYWNAHHHYTEVAPVCL